MRWTYVNVDGYGMLAHENQMQAPMYGLVLIQHASISGHVHAHTRTHMRPFAIENGR